MPDARSLGQHRGVLPHVQTFQHCPRCGSVLPAPVGNRLECSACGHRLFVNPTVAVAVIPELTDGRVLWIRRARDPGLGMLAMPGGFVDAGETAEAAARREVEEELGMALDRLQFVTSATNQYPFAGVIYDVLDLFFHARLREGVEWEPAAAEVSAVEVLGKEEVPEAAIAFPSMRLAWSAFLREREG